MLNTARLYASASSSAVKASKFEGMLIAIIFHRYKVLTGFAEAIAELKRERVRE